MELEQLHKEYGYPGKRAFHQQLRQKGHKFTQKQVNQFFEEQGEQLTKVNVAPSHRLQIIAKGREIGQYQTDLMDVSKWAKRNKGIHWLLNVIDIQSRKAWSLPIKSKTAAETARAILPILGLTVDKDHRSIIVDKGNEFEGAFRKQAEKLGYQMITINPHSVDAKAQLGIAERFNRTVLEWIKNHMYAQEDLNYIDELQSFIKHYNSKKHSTTKAIPNEVFGGEAKSRQEIRERPRLEPRFKAGDMVHYLEKTGLFDKKGFKLKFSAKPLKIIKYISPKYLLENGIWYYEEQLVAGLKKPKIKIAAYHKDVQDERRFERNVAKELGVKLGDRKMPIVDTVRIRKPTQRYK